MTEKGSAPNAGLFGHLYRLPSSSLRRIELSIPAAVRFRGTRLVVTTAAMRRRSAVFSRINVQIVLDLVLEARSCQLSIRGGIDPLACSAPRIHP